MGQMGLPSTNLAFIEHIILDRIVIGSIHEGKTNKGLPQGSCFSLLLFNIYIRDMARLLGLFGVRMLGFADDIIMYIVHSSIANNLTLMSDTLVRIERWQTERHLNISLTKSKLINFDKTRYPQGHFTMQTQVGTIGSVEQIKYLGVIRDQCLE